MSGAAGLGSCTIGELFDSLMCRSLQLLVIITAPPFASAQTACGASSGPDLVLEIGAVANYAATSGVESFSLGLMPLDIGDANVSYVASTNQHPVYGQSLYRLSYVDGASRIEELGQSWLRHGFATLSQADFCACAPTGTAALLGAGCNDSLSANLNGSPSGLGPRWQVDAATGSFPFPSANPPATGPHPRRIQVATGELAISAGTPGSTRFFAEVQTIAADDAAAGHATNNTSWTELATSVAAGEWSFLRLGATQREQSAIDLWAALDASVRVSTVDVPGDGRLRLGCAATEVAPGVWRYEYALENLTSDRSVGRFSVPRPNGMTEFNTGFHDVAYTNGDGIGDVDQSGADWSVQPPSDVIEWRTSTFATDPNANALRWSTTYNFRFDCDRAPMEGSVALGLFKPGTPSEVLAAALVPYDLAVLAVAFCIGDGTGTPCPCANHSPMGHHEGCLNSLGTGGFLRADGAPSVAHDSLSLQGVQMPNATALYLQGTLQAGAGLGTVLGDGLLCVDGALVRLGSSVNVFGASQYPASGQASVSVRGGASAGTSYAYQVWYRNAASFCTSSTFNLSNGVLVTWIP